MYHNFLKDLSRTIFNIDNNNVSRALNPHIRMIYEGLWDNEDWSTGSWKYSVAFTGINYILKHNNFYKIIAYN